MPHRDRGFTLVELVVVLTMIGTLAALALPRSADRNALQARGFAKELRALLRHSRVAAVTQQRGVCVQIVSPQVTAMYDLGAGCNPALPLQTPGDTSPYVVAVPTGLTLGGATLVRFNATGQPVPNANVAITAGPHTITVSLETGVVQ